MSWKFYEAVAKIDPELVKVGPRSILNTLALRADEDGFCFPSIPWIMQRTSCSNRTTTRGIRTLEEAGLLVVRRRRGAGNAHQYIVVPGHTFDSLQQAMKEKFDLNDSQIATLSSENRGAWEQHFDTETRHFDGFCDVMVPEKTRQNDGFAALATLEKTRHFVKKPVKSDIKTRQNDTLISISKEVLTNNGGRKTEQPAAASILSVLKDISAQMQKPLRSIGADAKKLAERQETSESLLAAWSVCQANATRSSGGAFVDWINHGSLPPKPSANGRTNGHGKQRHGGTLADYLAANTHSGAYR